MRKSVLINIAHAFRLLHQNKSELIKLFCLLTFLHFSIQGNAQSTNAGFSMSDTAFYQQQMNVVAGLATAAEFDSAIVVCQAHIAKLSKFTTNEPDTLPAKYLYKYLMYFHRISGMSYQLQTNYPEALKQQQEYLKYAEMAKSTKDIGAALTYIGYTHREMEDYKTALQFNTRALDILHDMPRSHQYANAICARSTLYYDLGIKGDSSVILLKHGLEIYQELGDLNNYVNGVLSMCEQLFKLGRWKECPEWLKNISTLIEEHEDPAQLAQYYVYVGRVAYQNGQLETAKKYFEKGYQQALLTENPYNVHGTAKYMSLILAATGEYSASIKMIEECIDKYSDDVNTEKARALNTIALNYQFEKEKQLRQSEFDKKTAIANEKMKRTALIRNVAIAGLVLVLLVAFLLFRLNSKLRASYEALRKTQETLVVTEKQRAEQNVRVNIARDIHDELGSGLTRITMLSGLARKKLAAAPDEVDASLVKITQYSRQVSASLNEIVWAVNPQSDTLEGLATYMKGYAQKFLEDTGIPNTLDFPESYPQIPVDPEKRRNIFLVLKESLNNTAKYADATMVNVLLQINERHLLIRISDNGKGMHTADTSTGNGLPNMQTRMMQSGFSFEIESAHGKGCSITISGTI